jgi:hypothetical protein
MTCSEAKKPLREGETRQVQYRLLDLLDGLKYLSRAHGIGKPRREHQPFGLGQPVRLRRGSSTPLASQRAVSDK